MHKAVPPTPTSCSTLPPTTPLARRPLVPFSTTSRTSAESSTPRPQQRGLGAEASTGQQGPPQALTTVGRPIHHRQSTQARHIQAGERKRRSLHQRLEYTTAMSLLSLEFRAICTSFVLAFLISRNNKEVCFTCLFFGNLPDPRGLGCARTQRNAWIYPRQSQASLGGYYGGNPRTSPKITNIFSKNFRLAFKLLVHLEKTDARCKQLR